VRACRRDESLGVDPVGDVWCAGDRRRGQSIIGGGGSSDRGRRTVGSIGAKRNERKLRTPV
jgi:hypothetical protein